MNSVLIINIGSLVGILSPSVKRLVGKQMSELNCIEHAFVSIKDGRISDFGSMNDLNTDSTKGTEIIDAEGGMVYPAYCDSHTHLVFAGSRENEFVDRIKGLSYAEIAARGGGILNSAKKLQASTEDELFDASLKRLKELILMGTGAIEIKSGYGLSTEGEIKMLRVIKRLKEVSPIPIKSNFLAAHAFPQEYKENHEGYLKLIEEEMLPIIHQEKLADYIDVFCESGFFSVDETARIIEMGKRYGLKAKIHANQLNYSGGVQIGVKLGAVSVDHLECVGEEEIECLKESTTIGTLLPGAAFFLGIPYQPARAMIDAGLGIALASDFNPGSCPSGNMNLILSLACTQLKMLPAEALNACTINGAYAMELSHELGSITIGKLAKLIITHPIPSIDFIPYYFGQSMIKQVLV